MLQYQGSESCGGETSLTGDGTRRIAPPEPPKLSLGGVGGAFLNQGSGREPNESEASTASQLEQPAKQKGPPEEAAPIELVVCYFMWICLILIGAGPSWSLCLASM